MNIFSNIGVTELVLILLLALLVVGPERLPELGRKLAKTLRDVRKAYENLTRDLGPELMSIQQTTQELRESVESIRSIPQDMVRSVVQAAEIEDTVKELKDSFGEVGQTVTSAGKMVKEPVDAAVNAARGTLTPTEPDAPGLRSTKAEKQAEREEDAEEEETGESDSGQQSNG